MKGGMHDWGIDCETWCGGTPDDEKLPASEPDDPSQDDSRECRSCMGYGHIDDETGQPTVNRQCRKCGDCNGTGYV